MIPANWWGFFMFKNAEQYFSIIAIVCITLIGAVFRLHALSPFKFYPDSYQNLLVAQSIANFHSVVGPLGTHGMIFPPFFMWSHPGYPLLINFATVFVSSTDTAAQLVATITAVLSIPLAFFMTKNLFRSTSIGVAAAFILALSFNHTAWSGFIMTETTGVLFLLLTLWSLSRNISQKVSMTDPQDIITGLLFGYSVMTRYEYGVLILPITLLIVKKSPTAKRKLLTIYSATFLIVAMLVWFLFPLGDTVRIIKQQTQGIVPLKEIIAGLTTFFIVNRFLPNAVRITLSNYLNRLTTIALLVLAGILSLQMFFPDFTFVHLQLSALRDFTNDDALLMSMTLAGLLFMLKNATYRIYAYAFILSALLLGPIYYRINSEMERYWTHLIPFFIIPAGYGLDFLVRDVLKQFSRHKSQILNPKSQTNKNNQNKNVQNVLSLKNLTFRSLFRIWNLELRISNVTIVVLLFFLIANQILTTYNGFRMWGDRSWYSVSYEEKAAKKVAEKITEKPTLLIASFPEPYYYFTRIPTQSIADTYPYIFMEDLPKDAQIIIIQDMGMYDLFPRFSSFLTKKLSKFRDSSFKIDAIYHYSFRAKKEENPIILYKIRFKDLIKIIN